MARRYSRDNPFNVGDIVSWNPEHSIDDSGRNIESVDNLDKRYIVCIVKGDTIVVKGIVGETDGLFSDRYRNSRCHSCHGRCSWSWGGHCNYFILAVDDLCVGCKNTCKVNGKEECPFYEETKKED